MKEENEICFISKEEFKEVVKECMTECMDKDRECGASGMMLVALGISYAGLAAKITDRLFKESEVTEETE